MPGLAQQSSGSLRGRVVEASSGKAKGGVQIQVRNLATNVSRIALTDAEGGYYCPLLPVGRYKITFQQGGSSYSVESSVALGAETGLNFSWPVESMATVVVAAQSEPLPTNTNSAETGITVSSDILQDLPVISRNVVSAAVLAPGVQLVAGANVDPTKKTATYVSNGDGQGRGTNFAIDGADNNSTDVGGYVSSIPLDAIAEFQVVTNQYKAEFGRSNAGFFNVVTKSGGNDFSGALSVQFTDQSLRARRTDEVGTPRESDGRLAATVSGPILKDRLFYMLSVERQDASGQPFVFPADAVQVFPALGGLQTKVQATTAYGKLDWNPRPNWALALNLGDDRSRTPHQAFPNAARVAGRIDPGMLGTSDSETRRIHLKSSVTGSNLAWESILGYFDYANQITPDPGFGMGTPMQIRTGVFTSDPTQRGRLGADPNAFQNTGIKRSQFKNDLTLVSGEHQLKAGFDLQHSTYADQHLFIPETGVFLFLTDLPYSAGSGLWASSFDPQAHYVTALLSANGNQKGQSFNQYGLYVQDDWSLGDRWRVYAGLRADKDTAFEFLRPYAGLYARISAANPDFIGSGLPKDRTYLSPRFSVIYKPKGDDSLVLRLGAGRFVAATIDNVVGFSRQLGNRANGLPNGGDLAYLPNAGPGGWFGSLSVTGVGPGPVYYENGDPYLINGHQLNLPAALTPYNYVNNVQGLRDYFRNTVDSWLTPASFDTPGKQLIDPAFEYPTTSQANLAVTFRWNEAHTLDVNLLVSRTVHATVIYTTDGSGPRAFSSDGTTRTPDPAHDMGDTIFRSNQTARSTQLQMKYTYARPNLSFLFSLVAKDSRSSYGGSRGAFDATGAADFYGPGATPAYVTGPERRSAGTENLLGSFAFNYKFAVGTQIGVLGTWHSGKAYDVTLGYYPAPDGSIGKTHVYTPVPIVGEGEGAWAMDLGLRVSQVFRLGSSRLEPFLQVSNLLNNYDYGANYNGALTVPNQGNTLAIPNAYFGQRGTGYQANNPRQAAFGFKWSF